MVALRQERLKLLVAYSTVAQIGYLFLMFPLAFDAGMAALERGGALAGGMLQAISHATAKAAMFMAAGLIYKTLGHDRIAEFAGIGRALPVSVLTFALAGLALMGLPPSGAFAAKKLLLDAAGASGQWWWEVVLDVGGLLTASYVVLVLAHALSPAAEPVKPRAPVSRLAEMAALALAICSLALGLAALGPAPLDALPNPLDPKEFGSALARPRRRRRARARPRASAAAAARRRCRRRVGAPRDGRDRRDVRAGRRGAAAVAGRGTRADRGGDRVRCRDARARLTAEVPWRN